jgi:hypothetical protein
MGGSGPGNSAVEVMPTPEENLLLLPYFLKRGILNEFRLCNLTTFRFPQKPGDLQVVRKTRLRPVPDMTENKTGFPEGENGTFFREKIRGSASGMPAGPFRGAFPSGDEVIIMVSLHRRSIG